jgi:hypothetical protein
MIMHYPKEEKHQAILSRLAAQRKLQRAELAIDPIYVAKGSMGQLYGNHNLNVVKPKTRL